MSLPPGLLEDPASQVQYIETSSGGDHDWLTFVSKKLYTNAFIVSPGPTQKVVSINETVATPSHLHPQILLGYKKRGFGAHLSVSGSLCDASAIH